MHKSLLVGLLIGLGSCATTNNKNASVVESPFYDKSYYPVYECHTKDYDVIENFFTNFTVSTTMIDDEFYKAFSERSEKIFQEKSFNLIVKPKQISYFISIYSPDRSALSIQNKSMWNIYLNLNGKKIRPERFKRMRPKSHWAKFFPTINFWSKEFLIAFDLPDANISKKDVELVMAGPKGQIKFKFND